MILSEMRGHRAGGERLALAARAGQHGDPARTLYAPWTTEEGWGSALELREKFGEPSGTRTRDPLIKSQVLYQLS